MAYVPALMADRPGTTIVVIPTTSLAIDQERACLERIAELPDRARFPRELAFHGELPETTRVAIRERLARGTQGIVFTSPESLTRALAAERTVGELLLGALAKPVVQWSAAAVVVIEATRDS